MKKTGEADPEKGSAARTFLLWGAVLLLLGLVAYQQYSLNQIRDLVSRGAVSLPVAPLPTLSPAARKDLVRADFLKFSPYVSGTVLSRTATSLELQARVPNIDRHVAFVSGETAKAPSKEDLLLKKFTIALDSETQYPLGTLDTLGEGDTLIVWPRLKSVYPLDPEVTSFVAGYVYPALPGITVDPLDANY